jgi:hypothetical protein
MKLTEQQQTVLLDLFEIGYGGWKRIAIKLLNNETVIVAGNTCIWTGAIRAFIDVKGLENAFGCLEYSLDIQKLVKSDLLQRILQNKLTPLLEEQEILSNKISDIQSLQNQFQTI